MAIHHQLPIHRTGTQLLGLAARIHAQMPRGYKRTVGEKIVAHCSEMLDLMALANASRGAERVQCISEILRHTRAAMVWLRVGFDLRAPNPVIPQELWAQSVQLLDSVGKQASGWLGKTREKAPAAWRDRRKSHHESERQCEARWTRHADLCALEVDDAALSRREGRQLPALRRQGHYGLRTLAGLRLVPHGHGRVSRPLHDAGSNQSGARLRAGQLPLGNEGGAEPQPAIARGHAHAQRRDAQRHRLGAQPWHDAQRAADAPAAWLDDRARPDAAAAQAAQRSRVTRVARAATLQGDRL